MAKIVHSDLAPSEAVHYTLAGAEFDLGGAGDDFYETNDRAVLSNAEVHPWLAVEYDPVEQIAGEPRRTLADRPDLDSMSGMGPNAGLAFDPEEIRKVEEAKAAVALSRVALDAQLPQDEKVVIAEGSPSPVAATLAADDGHEAADTADNFKSADDNGKDA